MIVISSAEESCGKQVAIAGVHFQYYEVCSSGPFTIRVTDCVNPAIKMNHVNQDIISSTTEILAPELISTLIILLNQVVLTNG